MAGAVVGASPGRPRAVQRWQVTVPATPVGVVVGAGGAMLRSRWRGQDTPNAQEPLLLRAVVDHGGPPLAG